MKWNSLLIFIPFACALSASVCVAATYKSQDDLRSKVSQAVSRAFPQEAESSRKQLIALGVSAIPFIVEIVQSGANLTPIKKAFLIDIVASLKGQQSASALTSLLGDTDPYVRGLAATYAGKQRLKVAVPHLVNLLNDKEVYKTIVQTDPFTERDVLVRDVAIETLQAIAGIALAQRGSKDEQVKAWLRWWHKQQS